MAVLTDLLLFGPDGFNLASDNWQPAGARGANKVASRFIYALLTPTGTIPGKPSAGSPFISMARNFHSEFEIFAAFKASENAAINTVKNMEDSSEDASEKFGSVKLSSVSISQDEVTLSLSITAADGSIPSTAINFNANL